MPQPSFICKCGEILVKSQEESGGYRIRGKQIITRGHQVYSVCKSCNAEVLLPLEVTLTVRNPKLFIRR